MAYYYLPGAGTPRTKNTITANVRCLQLKWSVSALNGSVTAQPVDVHGISIAGQHPVHVVIIASGGNSILSSSIQPRRYGSWTRNFGSLTPRTWGLPDGLRHRSAAFY